VNQIGTPYQTIIFMGKTGCGKGTQASRLAKELGFRLFSTGDSIRYFSQQETSLGRHIKAMQVAGWVPEWLASYLFVKEIMENAGDNGVVFESVARKLEEARKLHDMHTILDRSYIVLYLDVPDEVVIDRMQKRQRDESDSDINIQKRLDAFYNETVHSIDYFTNLGKVITIDGNRSTDDIYSDILKAVTTN